ncbi:uncharacterized protein LOC101895679 [Musca domestica]|uniref:Uncharacterized protein LOC101895679 isoform X1 n=1 Tax=Musca domestica TaxID=7370 RepID=A0A1I8N8W8_MUSDO|nr:uncharacterized protein LOC101895679 [Musca domestica]XP_019894064.1 uncharacterized protein LOC101895679 [Musca domestica]
MSAISDDTCQRSLCFNINNSNNNKKKKLLQYCHQFPVLSCQQQICSNAVRFARNGKSYDNSSNSKRNGNKIRWSLGWWCLLATHLFIANPAFAQPPPPPTPLDEGLYLQQQQPQLTNANNIYKIYNRDTIVQQSTENLANENLTSPQNKGRRQYAAALQDIDKEVVERLIRQWAPVVWLAPEEKFMPLGVEEFLAHVHPESKDNSFTPGISFGENSEKSYLVTNAEIDQLLENETSFIYGRNPNVSPVPIYAVVTLCNTEQLPLPQSPNNNQNINIQQLPLNYAPPVLPPGPPSVPLAVVQQQQQRYAPPHPPEITKATRGPYIPVTLGPQDQFNNTIRRSSRLYPLFKRTRRNITPVYPNNLATPQLPITPFDLVMGESAPVPELLTATMPPTRDSDTTDDTENVNNFIANLSDNVKFSIPFNDQENILDNENKQQTFAYREGTPVPSFHVTYWMFYPYSQGKNMCTLKLGPFGRIPFPAVYGYCLGRKKDIGSHIGDWEHMTLYFTGAAEPEAMYVSAHDAGAYYTYNRLTGSFEFKRQETRKGILQRPNFPKTVTTFNDHPVLFAAKGSHGLWTAPGKHRFVKVARLYDINGFGTPWNTWKSVTITYENLKSYGRSLAPTWLSFKGKWGNPKSKCHPLRRIGLNFCEYTDGPTGIPLKEPHFQCGASYRR